MAGSLYRCEVCRGLSSACASLACRDRGVLNRPFVRYCRRCGDESSDSPRLSAAWQEGGRSAWDQPIGGIAAAEEAADLSRLEGSRRSVDRVALAMAQGLLAVHQGGGFLALLHPFARPEDDVAWTAPDPGPESSPFDPLLLPGGRDLIFATARRVSAVDLWGCARISAYRPVAPRAVDLGDGMTLMAAPVALGERTLGLIGLSGDTWRWAVWDLDQPRDQDAQLSGRLASGVVLPIEGRLCQAALVAGGVLSLATPLGHWVWRRDDARAGAVAALRRTWPGPSGAEGRTIALSEQVHRPSSFDVGGQVQLAQGPVDRPSAFDWYFRVTGPEGRQRVIQRYRVRLDDLEAELPRPLADSAALRPVGLATGAGGVREPIFVGPSGLRRLRAEVLAACDLALPATPSGLRLFDPLVVALGPTTSGRDILQVHSLRHPTRHAVVNDLGFLYADPLLWSRWLFTVERDDGDRLMIRRREWNPTPPA